MVSIEKIKQHIESVIDREIAITQKEITEFEEKIHGNEQCYGLGGWYNQFNKAKERREVHVEELKALKKSQGGAVILDNMKLYPFYCPSCQRTIYLDDSAVKNYREDTIDCPLCTRPICRSAKYIEWKIQRGSRYARLHGE